MPPHHQQAFGENVFQERFYSRLIPLPIQVARQLLSHCLHLRPAFGNDEANAAVGFVNDSRRLSLVCA